MPSEDIHTLAEKIFNESAGKYPRIINKKVKDYNPEDIAKIFDMLGELSAETAKSIRAQEFTSFIDAIDLAGLLMDAIKNNCNANLMSLAKLKQFTKMRLAEGN